MSLRRELVEIARDAGALGDVEEGVLAVALVEHPEERQLALASGFAAACLAFTPPRISNSDGPCHASPSNARFICPQMRSISLIIHPRCTDQ